jgi:hypothetical protein
MSIGVFIDGPLAGEVKSLGQPAPPRWYFPLPRRMTICECDPERDTEHEYEPKIQEYYRICVGPNVAVYSVHDDDETLLRSLKEWIVTDLRADLIAVGCHDRRAFC